MFKTILQNIDLIEANEEAILDMWMEYEIVQQRLKKSNFKIGFFREKFAAKVLEYAVSVVKGEHRVGNCPVMGVMLMLFKKKNIPLSDIFIICVHLKNALLHFCIKNSLMDEDMLREISILMDYNFEGVVQEYVIMYYNDSYRQKEHMYCVSDVKELELKENETKKVEVKKTETEILTEKLKQLKAEKLKKAEEERLKQAPAEQKSETEIVPKNKIEVVKVTSAKEYLMDIDLDYEMVAELDELESEVLDALYSTEIITQDMMDESAQLFEQYAKVLNTLYEFEELSYTLTILKDLLFSTDLNDMDDETKEMVGAYLKAIIGDLHAWRMAVFISCQAEDIHYLDKTLLSSIAQLQITLLPQDHDAEDEIEFF